MAVQILLGAWTAGLRAGLMTIPGMADLLDETDASEEERSLALSRLRRMAGHE